MIIKQKANELEPLAKTGVCFSGQCCRVGNEDEKYQISYADFLIRNI